MEKIYKRFKEIAKPMTHGLVLDTSSKEGTILKILEKYNAYYEQGIGIIVPSITETPTKVLVSHYDLVGNFNNGFAVDKNFIIADAIYNKDFMQSNMLNENPQVNGNFIIGALDNTITNAFLIEAIIELRENNQAEDIMFLFTDYEESGLRGMSSFMDKIHPKLNDPFYINLDVTNDNQDFNGSIEFDYPCISIAKEILNNLSSVGLTHQRFTDDTSAITYKTPKAFSYCIPTFEYCHTYASAALTKTIEPYYEGLKYLITTLKVDKYENDLQLLNNKVLNIL